ncbi:MAG: hypothetical protein VR68_15835 [Peptococcaceae bacterium BRH_c4a]|nr:MAG: hypothetical protein VR68_15835 [Peptococcaceae bacterium BRH_c4a]
MSEPSGENLSLTVEKMIHKMERIHERQAAENDRIERIMSSLESLSQALSRMESGRNLESEFYKRIDLLNQSLERIASFHEGEGAKGVSEGTIERVVQGVKVFGQVVSAVAIGIQVIIDNVGTALNKDPEGNVVSPDKVRTAKTQADLSMLLLPVSTLVKNLVDEKLKKEAALNKDEAQEQFKIASGSEGDSI